MIIAITTVRIKNYNKEFANKNSFSNYVFYYFMAYLMFNFKFCVQIYMITYVSNSILPGLV